MNNRLACLMCAFVLCGATAAHANGPVDVDSFVNAHYQEYHIDTFAVEPLVWVWVDLVDMNLSQLDSLGFGTAKGTWMSTGLFSTEIPVRLIDSVRALASVKVLHYETWQEYFREYIDLGGRHMAIDTSGPEPVVRVSMVTNGDYSQLDSLGIVYAEVWDNHLMASIPLRQKQAIAHLKTVKSISVLEKDVHVNGAKLEGLPTPPAGTVCGLARGSSGSGLSAELNLLSTTTGIPEQVSASRKVKQAEIDKEGRFCFVRLIPGLYSLIIRRDSRQHSDSTDSGVSPADSGVICAVVDGIEVQGGKTSLVEVNMKDIPGGCADASAEDNRKTTWVPRYISE